MFCLLNVRFRPLAAVCCSIIFSIAAGSLAAAGELTSLSMGFGGQGKVGKWLPIAVSAEELPAGAEVELRVAFPDPRGDTCVETAAVGTVSNSGLVELSGYFRSGRIEGNGRVSIHAADTGESLCSSPAVFGESVSAGPPEDPVQRTLALRKQDVLSLLTVGDVEGIDELMRNAAVYSAGRSILQRFPLESLSELPDRTDGLEAVDIVLLTDDFRTSAAQADALKQWVRSGGRLFVSAGGSVGDLLSSELGRWVGQHFEIQSNPVQMRRFSTLEAFVSGGSRIQTNLNRRDAWPVAAMKSGQLSVLVDSLDGPVMGSLSIGSGVVTMIGVDLNQLPFNRWTSLPQFYEVLFFGEKLTPKTAEKSRSSRVSQSGVSDVATQLLTAVDTVPSSGRWSTRSVMAMLVAWLILIGPLDYLLVTRLLKRPELTWLTFPLWIVGGATALFVAAGNTAEVRLQQLNVVDVMTDSDERHLIAQSWMSVSAPQTMKAALTAEQAFLPLKDDTNELSLAWCGRPEDIFGAMYRKGGISLGRQSFGHSQLQPASVTSLPLLINGSRALQASWNAVADQAVLTSNLRVSGFGMLNGTFSHNLPGTIDDWIIVHGSRVYRADTAAGQFQRLEPGMTWDSKAPGIYASDLKAFLNGARLVQDEESRSVSNRGSTQVVTPYDAQSKDAQYIITIASFYDASGGPDYVGLSHTQLRNMDISDTVRLNHAVLIGQMDVPVTSLNLNGQPIETSDSRTFVRLFLPVDRRPPAAMAPTRDELEETKTEEQNADRN